MLLAWMASVAVIAGLGHAPAQASDAADRVHMAASLGTDPGGHSALDPQPRAHPRLQVRYGGDRSFPPYESQGPDGQPMGFQIDLLRAISAISRLDFEIVLDDWDSIIGAFREGSYDVIAMSRSAQRSTWAHFSIAHGFMDSTVYRHKDAPEVNTLRELDSHPLVLQRSALTEELFSELGLRATVVHVPTVLDALALVDKGQYPYTVVPRQVGDREIEDGTYPNLRASRMSLLVNEYAFAVLPGEAAIRSELESALLQLKRSGVYDELYTRWFGSALPALPELRNQRSQALQLAALTGLCALAAIGWVYTLRRQVAQRTAMLSTELERRTSAEAALRESEEKFATVFRQSPNPMVLHEFDSGVILEANNATLHALGTDREALRGRPIRSLEALLEPEAAMRIAEQLLRAGVARGERTRFLDRHGTARACEVSAEMLMLSGRPCVLSVIHDIEDITQAQRALQASNEVLEARVRGRTAALEAVNRELAQANQELETFSYSVSHDLRAPLRHIRGFAELWRDANLPEPGRAAPDGTPSPDAQPVERILAAAGRMERVIEGMLQLASAGRALLTRTDVDMLALVQSVWNEFEDEPSHARTEFTVTGLPAALGDPHLLRQVWFNLLGNALKYASGAKPPRVQVDCIEQEGHSWYRVTDNGAGFDAAWTDQLFVPFKRLHSQEAFAGTGIGLSIVRRIVERHGGMVRAEALEQGGARFSFHLGQASIPGWMADRAGVPV